MRRISLLLLICLAAPAQTVPIIGVASIRFRVHDIEKARAFYTGVFGLAETAQGFRVNDRQYLTFLVDASAGPQGQFVTISFEGQRKTGLLDTDDHRINFIQYEPSGQGRQDRQISDHFHHLGLATRDLDRALRFYIERLGFKEHWRGPTPTDFKIAILKSPGPGKIISNCS